MESRTGCRIYVVRHESAIEHCNVIVKGDIDGIARVESMIRRKITDAFRQEYLHPPRTPPQSPQPSPLPQMDSPQQQRATPSLVHLTLKATALQWHLFEAGDIPMLAGLPLQLRLALAEYLHFYGAVVDVATWKVLQSGSEKMSHLTLAAVVGQETAISRFLEQCAQPRPFDRRNAREYIPEGDAYEDMPTPAGPLEIDDSEALME